MKIIHIFGVEKCTNYLKDFIILLKFPLPSPQCVNFRLVCKTLSVVQAALQNGRTHSRERRINRRWAVTFNLG